MTSSSWDDYVPGGDAGVTASESDVAYAGIDAAAASAVTTDIVDTVIADEPADAASTPDWADWNAATGHLDLAASAQDNAVYLTEYQTDVADDHAAAASDQHDATGSDHQPAEHDLDGYDPSSADTSQ